MSRSTQPESRRLSDEEVMRAVPPTAGARELRVGVFVILGLVGFITVLFLMTNPATFRGRYMLTTHVEDAQGLRKGDAVQMRGINIGRVHRFDLDGSGVLITLEIEGEWRVAEGSRAELKTSGVLGGVVVSVTPGQGERLLEPMEQIPGDASGAADLFETAGRVAGDAGEVLAQIQAVLSDSAVAGVGTAVSSLNRMLAELAALAESESAEISAMVQSLRGAAENVEGITASDEWSRTLASAESVVTRLDGISEVAGNSLELLQSVLARADGGEGTLGRLLTDDSLYESLDSAAQSLAELLDDVKANPGRYIKIEVF